MFQDLTDFITTLMLHMSEHLPQSNIDIDSQIHTIQNSELLGWINWIVPFYLMAPIFATIVTTVCITVGVFVLVKFILNKFVK